MGIGGLVYGVYGMVSYFFLGGVVGVWGNEFWGWFEVSFDLVKGLIE